MTDGPNSTINRIMHLTTDDSLRSEKYIHFDLNSYCPGSIINADEQFHCFSLDLIRRLSEGHVVNYDAGYRQLKPMRKKLFSKVWIPAVYRENIHIDNLHNELISKNYDNCWYAVIESIYEKKSRKQTYKKFSLIQNRLNMDLFLRFMMVNSAETGCDEILIYPDIAVDISRFKTSDEIIQHYSELKYLFLIVSHDPEPLIHIDMNIDYFTAEQLIRIIKSIAEKHSFTLEIEDRGI